MTPDPTERAGEQIDAHWSGTVTLSIDLLDLPAGRIVSTATGKAEFHGSMGVLGSGGGGSVGGNAPAAIVIPYALGKGFPRALDQAARHALMRLYGESAPNGDRP